MEGKKAGPRHLEASTVAWAWPDTEGVASSVPTSQSVQFLRGSGIGPTVIHL